MTNFPTKPSECDHPFSKRFDFEPGKLDRDTEGCDACGSIKPKGELLWIGPDGERIPKTVECPDGARGVIRPREVQNDGCSNAK